MRPASACLAALLAVVPPFASAGEQLADHVLVNKSERKLYLLQGESVLAEYDIALGRAPDGHKQQEGDQRTPEGSYYLTNRRINSDFFMSIQISYPDPGDIEKARKLDVEPGGQIMLHGQPNVPLRSAAYYRSNDWTDGCIAVSNSAMVDIWELTNYKTPITILP